MKLYIQLIKETLRMSEKRQEISRTHDCGNHVRDKSDKIR